MQGSFDMTPSKFCKDQDKAPVLWVKYLKEILVKIGMNLDCQVLRDLSD